MPYWVYLRQEIQRKTKADIHDFDKRITSVFKRLNSQLSAENMLLVNRYYNSMLIDGVGKAVQEKHLSNHDLITETAFYADFV